LVMRGGVYSLTGKSLIVCDDPSLRELVASELEGFGIGGCRFSDRLPKELEPSVANLVILGREAPEPFRGVALTEDLGSEHFKLRRVEHEGRRYWLILSPSARGRYYGFLKFLEGRDEHEDEPGFDIRGVVEGFYGPSWSWEDRQQMIRLMSDLRMNLYIYAPKEDPLHRSEWRKAYEKETMERFSALVELARSLFIRFCFALSPGLDIEYSSDGDIEAIVSKLEAFYSIGVRDFAIFLDDIPGQLTSERDKDTYESLGKAQRHLLEEVLQRLRETDPGIRLFFCPTEYHGTEVDAYLEEISKLPQEIIIFWTGPKVCSTRITSSDAQVLKEALKRKILIWDNYPVNDYAPRRLHLNAVRNRDPDLATNCVGLVSNPMSEAEASKVALFTYGEYLWDPKGYDPDTSLDRALTYVFGPAALRQARILVRNLEDLFYPDSPEGAIPRIEEVDDIGMERLLVVFGEMESVSEIPTLVSNERLIREIKGHLEKISDLGRLGKAMIDEERLRRRILINKSMVRAFRS